MFVDAEPIHAYGKPASSPLLPGAGSSKAEEDFQRAFPASVDFGAVDGRYHHFCLHFHFDYGLGLAVSMGHTAN
jgi:hypothetical protein